MTLSLASVWRLTPLKEVRFLSKLTPGGLHPLKAFAFSLLEFAVAGLAT